MAYYTQIAPDLTIGFPFPAGSDLSKRVGGTVAEMRLPDSPLLVKYGSAKHMEDALRNGRIRLGSASSYSDPSLNPARQDNELKANSDMDTTAFAVAGLGSIGAGSRLKVATRITTDFYVYCMSEVLRPRLFLDFHSDACLIVSEPEEFRSRLLKAVAKQLRGHTLKHDRVMYYDPLSTSPREFRPVFWKHFRHSYQEEVRFAVTPPQRTQNLDGVFLTLGSLEDIAKMHRVQTEI